MVAVAVRVVDKTVHVSDPLFTVTVGTTGGDTTAQVEVEHPFAVTVTQYVPLCETVIVGVVSPVGFQLYEPVVPGGIVTDGVRVADRLLHISATLGSDAVGGKVFPSTCAQAEAVHPLLVTVMVTQYCPAWETARFAVVAAPGFQK